MDDRVDYIVLFSIPILLLLWSLLVLLSLL